MGFIIAWLVKKFGISFLITAISVLYFAVVIAFYIFLINSLLTIYHLVQQFLDLFSNSLSFGGGSEILSLFASILNIIGFTPALTASMPLITSALVFYLLKFAYKITKQAYKDIVAQTTRAANLYV